MKILLRIEMIPSLCRPSRIMICLLSLIVSMGICTSDAFGQDDREAPSGDDALSPRERAAELFAEARKYDGFYGGRKQSDREKAVLYYRLAMEADPDSPKNAAIARRLAQMWAWYGDRKNGTGPDRVKAEYWYRKSIELASDDDPIFVGEGCMGLACATTLQQKPCSALAALNKLFATSPTDHGLEFDAGRRSGLQERIAELQVSGLELFFTSARKIGGSVAACAYHSVAERITGEAGRMAAEATERLCARRPTTSVVNPLLLPEWAFAP